MSGIASEPDARPDTTTDVAAATTNTRENPSRRHRASRGSKSVPCDWIALSSGAIGRTQFARMLLATKRCESARCDDRHHDDDDDDRGWRATRETRALDDAIDAASVAFAEWYPRFDATDDPSTDAICGGELTRHRRRDDRGVRAIRGPRASTRAERRLAIRRSDRLCLGSLTYLVSRRGANALAEAMLRHRETRLALIEGTSALRLDSINAIDGDPTIDDTVLDETVRVERARADTIVERRSDRASSAERGFVSVSRGDVATSDVVARSVRADREALEQDRRISVDRSREDRRIASNHGANAESNARWDGRDPVASRDSGDDSGVDDEDAAGRDARAIVRDVTRPTRVATSDVAVREARERTATIDRASRGDESGVTMATNGHDETNVRVGRASVGGLASTDGRGVERRAELNETDDVRTRDERTVSVRRVYAGGGDVNPDVEESGTRFRSSVRESTVGTERVESSRDALSRGTLQRNRLSESRETRKRTRDDLDGRSVAVARGTSNVESEEATSRDVSSFEDATGVAAAKRQRLGSLVDDEATTGRVSLKRNRDVAGMSSSDDTAAVASKRRTVRGIDAVESTLGGSETSGRETSGRVETVAGRAIERATSLSGGADARGTVLRRRCRSVLQRALLSSEYRRACVRRDMRYEDLMSRIAISCATLDESSRSEADRIFGVARSRYIGSLYEVSRLCFVQHDATARAMLRRVWHVASLWSWRECGDLSARTHEWLLRRVVDEYARSCFFRTYEYVRSFELYVSAALELRSEVTSPAVAKGTLAGAIDALRPIAASHDRRTFEWLRDTIRVVRACVRIVECVVTANHGCRDDSREFDVASPSLARVASSRGIVEVAWSTIDSHARGADDESPPLCRDTVAPVWNLLLNNRELERLPKDATPEERIRRVERDEFFDLYRVLSECDRDTLRNDAVFYVGVFERLRDAMLRSIDETADTAARTN